MAGYDTVGGIGATGRALAVLPVTNPAPSSSAVERPLAGFVTQLIACEARLPGYRRARQAEPDTAQETYLRGEPRRSRRLDVSV